MDGEHPGDPGGQGEDVPGLEWGQAEGLGEGGCSVCAGAHVLIWIHTEYERQAETQLVTSELAPVISGSTLPSASSSTTPRTPPSAQLNETAAGAAGWAGDTTQGPRFNETKCNHLPPPQNTPQPVVVCSLLSSPRFCSSCRLTPLGKFCLCCPYKG